MKKFDPYAWMAHRYLWKNRKNRNKGIIYFVLKGKFYRQVYSFGIPSQILRLNAKY